MKLLRRLRTSVTDAELELLRQLGIRWARADLARDEVDYPSIRRFAERLADYDIRIYSAVFPVPASTGICLGGPERAADVDAFHGFLEALGRLQIPVSGYAFHPQNVYTTSTTVEPGYRTRVFDADAFRRDEPLFFGREVTAEELHGHHESFLKEVLPQAGSAGVRLALHPDDPPLPKMGGVARIFAHADGYRRVAAIVGDTPYWGLLFCVGTWAEGGRERMGGDVFEMIREFGGAGRIISVHVRNVSSTLPVFYETLRDGGYVDLRAVVAAFAEVGFDGSICADHVPALGADTGINPAGTAYCTALITSYLRDAGVPAV